MKLEVRDIACGYRAEKPVLEHITFSVQSGEVCCVLGPNGVGKSTLFRSILGTQPLKSGKVLIDGEDATKWGPTRLAKQIAYVSQAHIPPFPYAVKDVVMMGRIGQIPSGSTPSFDDFALVENALAAVGIEHLRDEVYTNVSGGELELVMIARALVQEPQLLVLDEPTAALDYGNAMRVIGKIRELASSGLAILMTTHSPDHAFMCDSNVVLLQRELPMRWGRAVDVITERNMQQAFGISVKIVEFVDTRNEIMRLCAPSFKESA